MSTYDDSSLFIYPSGYKASVLFAQKPMDASGQLAFTRSNDTATRVASNGLIEKVRTNLILRSEEFDNAAWTKTEATITANASTSPIGTTTADKIIPSTNNAAHFFLQDISLTSGIPYTQSIYAKADGYSFLQITGSSGFNTPYANFDLSNGTLGSTDGGLATITSVGNGWYRLTYTVTAIVTGSGRFVFAVVSSSSSARLAAFAGNGTSGVLLWGAQAETGDIATDYIPTTASAVSVGPVANIPRIDYLGGGCGKLLLEPQRTNSILWSEQLQNWGPTNTTVTANVLVSPDGYQNADTIVMNDSTSRVSQGLSFGAGTYTASVYAKLTSGSGTIRINLIVDGLNSSFNFTPTTEWVRYTYTVTAATGITAIQLRGLSGTPTVSFWGAQVEAGAYATSYIPTLAASVTRGADSCSKQNIAGTLPTAYPFTLYAEGFLRDTNDTLIGINDLSASDVYYSIGATASGFFARARNTTESFVPSTTGRSVGTHKVAAVFTSSEIRLFANGALIATGANAQVFNTNAKDVILGQLRVTSDLGQRSSVNQALVFKSALSDADCIALTA